MQLLCEIVASRTGGEVIAECTDRAYTRPEEAAGAFGLSSAADTYTEVPAEEALAVLANVINKDMAYDFEFMPYERAKELATAFLFSFPQTGTRFFTNGTFGKERESPNIGPSWSPATEATFDTGVLVLAAQSTACVWFKDED